MFICISRNDAVPQDLINVYVHELDRPPFGIIAAHPAESEVLVSCPMNRGDCVFACLFVDPRSSHLVAYYSDSVLFRVTSAAQLEEEKDGRLKCV